MKQIKIQELEKAPIQSDIFICCSSFEERCLTIPRNLNKSSLKTIIICNFENNYEKANKNLIELKKIFKRFKIIEITIFKNNPLANYDNISGKLKVLEFTNALLDISTFTRETFLIILKLFQQFFNKKCLKICYTPSINYSDFSGCSSKDKKIWLSKGVSEIRSVVGYAGDFSPLKKFVLIVLVGIEAERSQTVIDNFEPDLLYIGKSPEDRSNNKYIANLNGDNFNRLKNMYSFAKTFDFSCCDINETINSLTNIIKHCYDDYNIIISPMNNKISTLATAKVVQDFPKVQICYAATNIYNVDTYSTPSDCVYFID